MSDDANGLPVVQGRFGTLRYFPSDDPIGKALGNYGEWAQAEIDLLAGFVGLGSTVVDVGANIGTHTLALSHRVGPTGEVIAFEPQKAVFNVLRRNVQENGLSNVTVHHAGVGGRAGWMKVPPIDYSGHVNIGGVSLSKNAKSIPGDKVPIVTIDSLSLPRCHLVKVDTEGMEDQVLIGMTDTIRRLRPIIFAECNGFSGGIKIIEILKLHRYSFYLSATAAYNPNNLSGNPTNFFGYARETNLVCIPDDMMGLAPECGELRTVTPVDGADALATAIFSVPRYGDKTPHDRNANWLLLELQGAEARVMQLDARLQQESTRADEATTAAEESQSLAASLIENVQSLTVSRDRLQTEASAAEARRADLSRKLEDETARSSELVTRAKESQTQIDRLMGELNALNESQISINADLCVANQRAEEAIQSRKRAEFRAASLRKQLDALEEKQAKREAALYAAEAKCAALSTTLRNETNRVNEATSVAEHLRTQIAEIHASLSWRLGRPVRVLEKRLAQITAR